MRKKHRTIDGEAIYLMPGFYEIENVIYDNFCPHGHWPIGARFAVERHVATLGHHNVYEYFSIRRANSDRSLVNSYQKKKWNFFATELLIARHQRFI